MTGKTAISWTQKTWNPMVGCSVISAGCTNCYAMQWAGARMDGNPNTPHYKGTTKKVNGKYVWTGHMAMAPDHIVTATLRWQKPALIFVNSMSDLFHENVPFEWVDKVFAVMALTPQHTYQIPTKRPDRMREYLTGAWQVRVIDTIHLFKPAKLSGLGLLLNLSHGGNLPNVWLGVSVEDQKTADQRIPILLDTPAAIRFISAEPLLGKIDLTKLGTAGGDHTINALTGHVRADDGEPVNDMSSLAWVIIGGESGADARPMHPDWARSLRDQCASAGVPFFFKQWGEWEVAIDRQRDDPDWRRDYTNEFADRGKTKWLNLEGGSGFHGERFHVMRKVGKALAGDLLDGVQHHAMPERIAA